MTSTYSYTPTQLAQMSSAIAAAKAYYAAGNYSQSNKDLIQYYQAQVTSDPSSNRGYAQAAIDVINDTGGGAVANLNVQNYVGSAYTAIYSILSHNGTWYTSCQTL